MFGISFLGKGNTIHIKKENEGKFTASAKRAGQSVQEHARSVLNNPKATPLQKKRANFARNAAKWKHQEGGILQSAGSLVNAIYNSKYKDKFLGKPAHSYDFIISEKEANRLGYYPDERGHRDDRVKKVAHPTHPSKGSWKSFYEFKLSDKGFKDPNYVLFGLADGEQDPQAIITYNKGVVLPEFTVTPNSTYIYNSYDNMNNYFKK